MNHPELVDADRVWFRITRLNDQIATAITRRFRRINLSTPQYEVLTALTDQEGMSQQDLAERLFVTKGNVSGLIDRLSAAGLVERRQIEGDRRTHALYLTPQGRRLATQALATRKAFVAETFGRLSPAQLAQMDTLLVLTRDILQDTETGRPTSGKNY